MPELPEVETTLRGLAPHLPGQTVAGVAIRQPRLRWPIPAELPRLLHGQRLLALERRGKYLLFRFAQGTLLLHLGMSGSLRLLTRPMAADVHEHFDLIFIDGSVLRLRDPRRFGAVLWQPGEAVHPLLAGLGPEPLTAAFDGAYLYARTRRARRAIKLFIMDNHVVTGVGNIYANEALFRAGIRPQRAAGRLSGKECARLAQTIKETLQEAIAAGGSSLRDYVDSNGHEGWFQMQHGVYGRSGAPCRRCGATIRQLRQGQRSSFYCPACQK